MTKTAKWAQILCASRSWCSCSYFAYLRLDFEHRPVASALHFGVEGFPGVCGQDTILTRLQRDEGVRQHVGACGEEIRTEKDAIVTDLRFVEQPPAPTFGEGIAVIELNLNLRGIDALLAGF